MGSMRIAFIVAALLTWTSAAAVQSPGSPKASIVAEKKHVAYDIPKHPKWLEICGQLAPATSVLCSLAPIPTILEMSRTKSIGSLPLLPYSSMATNGFIWTLYGWLTDSPSVKWANFMGMVLGGYYFMEFKKYSPAGSSNLPGTMKQHLIVMVWVVLANSFLLTNFPRKTAADIIGKEGTLIYIILFASPLAALKTVLDTQNAASIPLPFTVASTINCSLWSVAGLLMMKDFYIYFPCMMGLCSALAQLFLKGIYSSNVESATATVQEMSAIHIHAV